MLLIFFLHGRGVVQNRAIDSNRQAQIVARDESYNHRAVHWSDLHRLLYNALPAGIVQLGHEVISYEEESGVGPDKEPQVKVRVKKVAASDDENNIQEYTGDLMVAADGSMSQTREKHFPGEKRRFSSIPTKMTDYRDTACYYSSPNLFLFGSVSGIGSFLRH